MLPVLLSSCRGNISPPLLWLWRIGSWPAGNSVDCTNQSNCTHFDKTSGFSFGICTVKKLCIWLFVMLSNLWVCNSSFFCPGDLKILNSRTKLMFFAIYNKDVVENMNYILSWKIKKNLKFYVLHYSRFVCNNLRPKLHTKWYWTKPRVVSTLF